ncbi:MAG: MBL fold metallo-hydrolase [Planctomycetota bacterium]|nr:MAG: MBL fold metallo-hydrolase [Planctomycetota bacterium]
MFQGDEESERHNAAPFGFEPSEIDAVLLTHAHLDHCGRLPLLVQRGFRGRIFATAATRQLARLVLLDAAAIAEEDAARARRSRLRHGEEDGAGQPLYSTLDVFDTMDQFAPAVRYGAAFEVVPGVRATYVDAGHLLGSASVRLELEHDGRKRSVTFSGDIGNPGRELLPDPTLPPPSDLVVMECTYGDRQHRPYAESVEELLDAIHATFRRGGNVIIPTFALERTQELLYVLHRAVERGRLAPSTQVFLDSPMAISATRIFARFPEAFRPPVAKLLRSGGDPFAVPGLHMTREVAQSRMINAITGGAIIMAGSGMCTGGRVLHHLRRHLWRRESAVVFVGFAAEGTLGRQIIDGAERVEIFGETIPVRARIHTINGFSAHADRDALLAWQHEVGPAETVLVHGEHEVMRTFARALRKAGARAVHMPRRGERLRLDDAEPGEASHG